MASTNINTNNKRPHEEDIINVDSEDEGSGEHGPALKKAKGGGGLESTFTSFFSKWEVEKKQLEKEKKELAAEKKAWDETAKKLPRVVTTTPVKLNVGGVKFETCPDTLRAQQGSFFVDMLGLEPGDDGFYFIDREPTHFHQLVLNFLRGMNIELVKLPVPVAETLQVEAEFYRVSTLVDEIKEVLRPIFRPGPNYTVDSAWHVATKTGADAWNAAVLGPLICSGRSKSVQIMQSRESSILIGLGPTYIPQRHLNFQAPGCQMLNCYDGSLYNDGAYTPYYGHRIAARSIVEVQVDDNGDVYFIVDRVKQAKAFTVAHKKYYRLLVLMYAAGDKVKLL